MERRNHQKKSGREVFLGSRGGGAAEDPVWPTIGPEGAGVSLLPAFFGTRNDCTLLKERFGWMESDGCWWCGGGRQTREHLFKECRALEDEIRSLWKEVEEISGDIRVRSGGEIYKGRKGFCFGVDRKMVRPGNTSLWKLLGDERFVEAVLKFLECTGVGRVKQGVMLDR